MSTPAEPPLDAPTATTTAPVPRRRRRVWPIVLIVVLVAALVVAFVIADGAARSYAEKRIRTELVSALGVPASTDVNVDLGPGSVLLQALTGHLDTVDVSVPQLAFGKLSGAATVHATDVPLDRSKPLSKLAVTFTVSQQEASALAENFSGVTLDSVTLKQPDIIAGATVDVAVAKVPIQVSLQPSASQGLIVFTPTTIQAAGQTFTAEQLTSSPLLGGIAKKLLRQQSFCVAPYLPKVLKVTSAKVVGSTMVLGFTGDGAVLSQGTFSTKGTC